MNALILLGFVKKFIEINVNKVSRTFFTAMIEALKDPSVVGTLMHELREEIKKGFKDELKQMEKGLEERDKKINELSKRIEELEQYGRRNGVRIHGIKEQKGENTDQIVLDLAKSIGADIPKTALGRSHRGWPRRRI